MSRKEHRTQEKPKREKTDVKTVELQKMRGIINKLKKENARLRKDLERAHPQSVDDDTHLSDNEQSKPKEATIVVVVPNSNECPSCGAESLSRVSAGPKTIIACKNCSFRKVENGI